MKKLLILGVCISMVCGQAHAGFFKVISGIVLMAAGSYAAVDGFKEVVDKEWTERVIVAEWDEEIIIKEWDEEVVINEYDKEVVVREWDEDISNPSINISNWSWTKVKYITWWADAGGTVQNTGNVDLIGVKLTVNFYDSLGLIVSNDVYIDNYWLNLSVGASDTWNRSSNNCGIWEPYLADISVSYYYDPIYDHKIETRTEHIIETQMEHMTETGIEHKVLYGITHHKTYKKKNLTQAYAGVAAGAGGLYLIVDSILDNSRIKKAMKKRDIEIRFAQKPNYFGLLLTKRI